MSTVINVGINLSEFNQGMKQIESGLKGLGDTVGKTFAAVGSAVAGVGIASLKAGEDANQSLGAIASQTGQTEGEMQKLDKAVRDLALTQGRFTAQEMRESLGKVARHGQDTEHQMTMLSKGMLLADATGNTLGGSLKTLDALMVKFGTEVGDASKWVNTLAVAQQEMGISQDKMLSGLQRSAGIAQSASLSYDFLAASLSIAYQNGMSMETASTGLTGVFQQMVDPTSNVRKAMTELGVETIKNADGTTDAQGSFMAFIETLYAADPAIREQIMNTMNLSGSNLDLFTNLLNNQDALKDLTGMYGYAQKAGDDYSRVTEMADARTGGFSEAINLCRNMLQEILYTINDVIGTRFYEWINEATTELGAFIDQAKENGYIEQMAEAIMEIVDALINLVKQIIPIVVEWLPMLIEWTIKATQFLGENAKIVIGLWAAFKGYTIIKSVIDIFGGLKTATIALKGKKAIGGLAPAMGEAVGAKGGTGMLGGAGKLLGALGPKGWAVVAVVGGTVATINAVKNQRESMEHDFDEMLEVTESRTAAMAYSAAQNMGLMSDRASEKMTELMTEHHDIFMEMCNTGATKTEAMSAVVSHHYQEQKNNVERELTELERSACETWQRVYEETGSATEATAAVTEAGYDRMKREARNSLAELERDYQYYGEALPKGVETGLSRGEPNAFTAIGDFARGVSDRFKGFFGINSPSTLMAKYGTGMGQGLQNGLEESRASVESVATNVSEGIQTIFDRMPTQVQTIGRNVANGLRDGINENRQRVNDVANTIRDGLQTRWQQVQSDGERYGERTGSGFNRGLDGMRGGIMDTARNIGNAVSNTLSKALNINSPSRVMMELGEFTGEGYEIGILNMIEDIEKASQLMGKTAMYDTTISPAQHSTPIHTPIPHEAASRSHSQSDSGDTGSVVIHIDKMEVKDEHDIRKVSQELYKLIRRDGLHQGRVPL